ncbi:MAG: dihydrodipicolinate synthase family protein, partial [Planctomycetota bacterium]
MPEAKFAGGVYVAMVTPFDADEEVDLGAFRAVLEYVVGCGAKGILVAGTTGEAHSLSSDEREQLWRSAVKWARGRAAVLAGTGWSTTREALRFQEIAADCGCDAALALTPWFERPSQDGLLAYYSELAEAARIPLFAYHNPSRTGLDWPAEGIAEAARELRGGLAGVKDSAHRPERVRVIREGAPPGFFIFSGGAHQREEFGAAGADASISALANALPAEAVDAYGGDEAKRDYFAEVTGHLQRSGNLIALLKHMMNEMDLPVGRPRRPHDALPPGEAAAAPKLRYRGGAASPRPAERFGEDLVVHVTFPDIVEKCLAAPPPAGLARGVIYSADEDGRCYNHHAQIVRFGGRFLVGWSAGWLNEDSPGQVVMVSTSADGRDWSEPRPMMPPPEDRLRWTMGGFWELDG